MTASLALLLASLLTAGPARDRCYLVANRRILPCSASQAEIAAASAPEKPAASPAPPSPASEGTGVAPASEGGPPAASPAPGRGRRGDDAVVLEWQLADLEARLQAAEADRDEAERQRERAEAQEREALSELTAIRQELATARRAAEQAAQAREEVQVQLDGASTDLQQAQASLATGTVSDTDAALARAARVFGDAHARQGSAAIQAARDALARSDLFAARLAIRQALVSVSSAPALP